MEIWILFPMALESAQSNFWIKSHDFTEALQGWNGVAL